MLFPNWGSPSQGGGAHWLGLENGGWGGGTAGGPAGGAMGGGIGSRPAIGRPTEASGVVAYCCGCQGAASAESTLLPPPLAGTGGAAAVTSAAACAGVGKGADHPGGDGEDSEPSTATVRTWAT